MPPWGDGSNKWIPGTIETLQGEGKNDVAGVLDAAALNFDEGVGGLVSLVDDEPGNTAGPGQQEWEAASRAADEGYAAGAGEAAGDALGLPDWASGRVLVYGLAALVVLYLVRPLLVAIAGVTN